MRTRADIQAERDLLCIATAEHLGRLADEDQLAAGCMTGKAIAWRTLANRIYASSRDTGDRPPVRHVAAGMHDWGPDTIGTARARCHACGMPSDNLGADQPCSKNSVREPEVIDGLRVENVIQHPPVDMAEVWDRR